MKEERERYLIDSQYQAIVFNLGESCINHLIRGVMNFSELVKI